MQYRKKMYYFNVIQKQQTFVLQYVTLCSVLAQTQFFQDNIVISISYTDNLMVGTIVDLLLGQKAAQRMKSISKIIGG
jgi:hypothetical protein